MNQSLASLFLRRLITLEEAIGRSSDPEELQTMIANATAGGGNVLPNQPNQPNQPPPSRR
jgi:hypothetical protein